MARRLLFSRLIEWIRTGNVQMILLELVIVALGIFLGFQVDRAYESRRDDAIAVQHVERLIADVREDVEVLDRVVLAAQARLESVERVIMSVTDDTVAQEKPTQYFIDLEQGLYRFFFVSNDATFRELLSTGDMGLLPVALREAIFDYYADVRSNEQFDVSIQAVQNESFKRFAGVIQAAEFSSTIMLPRDYQRGSSLANIASEREYSALEALAAVERLRAKRGAVEWLPRLLQIQSQLVLTNEALLAAAKRLGEVLASARGEPAVARLEVGAEERT